MHSLGLQSHGQCASGYIVLAAWQAGAAARVHSVNGEVYRQGQVHLHVFHQILMKQQNPIENQYVGGKCHRPLYIW